MRQLKITQSITNRDAKSVERYLTEISKYHPLSLEEETECFKKIKLCSTEKERKESKKYHKKIINSNLRFVVSVAKQYQSENILLEDLINAGNEGLLIAADKFNMDKGFKFISYAVWWIRQSMIKFIQENGRTVYMPSNRVGKISSYKKFESKFIQEFEEKPTVTQIADNLKISEEEAFLIVNLSEQTTFSIDKKINNSNDSEDTMEEFLGDEQAETDIYKNIFAESLSKDLSEVMTCLSERERFVVTKYYNLDRSGEDSYEKIAEEIGVTKERVRQILDKGIHKLKGNNFKKKLVYYL